MKLGYLKARSDERQRTPTDDFMARLVAAYDEQEKRTDAELVATVALLLAGNETTTNLIFNATLVLCRFPERRRELRFDRPNAKHLAVGEWIHICLGQFLARM